MSTGTQVEVVMPQMGVSVSEGTVTRWLKQPGEAIALDEPLLEISTDKVDTEVPSPGEGVVAEIRVQEGETVEVGTVLAMIAPAGAAVAEPPSEPAPAEPVAETPPPPCSEPHRLRRPPPRRPPQPRLEAAARQRPHVRLAGRRADRGRARRRPERDRRHRAGRPRDEEGHPRVHRVRCPGTCGACTHYTRQPRHRLHPSPPHRWSPRPAPPAAPRHARAGVRRATRAAGACGSWSDAWRGRGADERDATRDRGAHAPLARHLRARDERDRGRHVEGRLGPGEAQEGVPGELRRQPDVPRVRREGRGRDAEGLAVGQRRDPRREDRHPLVRQPRHRGLARGRQGPDRPRDQERPGPQPARHRTRDRRARREGADEEAHAGRRPGRHVHDHEPRRLRHLPRDADHQPAAGGDPRHLRAREAAVGRPGRARPGRDRDPADDEPHADVRPPAGRRRLRGRLPARPPRAAGRLGRRRGRSAR